MNLRFDFFFAHNQERNTQNPCPNLVTFKIYWAGKLKIFVEIILRASKGEMMLYMKMFWTHSIFFQRLESLQQVLWWITTATFHMHLQSSFWFIRSSFFYQLLNIWLVFWNILLDVHLLSSDHAINNYRNDIDRV